jgi:PglZ domain
MSSIKEFIHNQIFLPRLSQKGIMVIYDPDARYHDLCIAIENDATKVIDASTSSITSREEALTALIELGKPGSKHQGILVYVPASPPLSDEDKQRDPFALYTSCGKIFPDGDGDEFMNLCLKAKPDHATEIRRVFSENPNPSFAVIDAIGGGTGWPTLQALLNVESARDILFALLAPSEPQKKALDKQEAWVSEAKELFAVTIGLKLLTKGKTWSSIGDELWRFLLFSEFVFDLPESLPESLATVPSAKIEALPLVEDLCDLLRNDRRTQVLYIDRAENIEQDLDLPTQCKIISNLGIRDTFPFEERSFLELAMNAIKKDDTDTVRTILSQHANSVWIGKGESQAQWMLVRSALSLIEACGDYERQLSDHSRNINNLIDYYINSLREADRLQREFEQAVADFIDAHSIMGGIIDQARGRYRRLTEKVQDVFIRHFSQTGWPPSKHLANTDVFDKLVAPKLQESGKRVAYFLLDALRYELGVALEKQLAEDCQVELRPAFAQLPTITSVGMASLLPEAGKNLSLAKQDSYIVPMIGDAKLTNVNQRMDLLRKRYGERFTQMSVGDFIRTKKNIPETVDLLVLRSVEIDSQLEVAPETALGLIHDIMKRIRVAIHKLKGIGFEEVVIATDHGFFLNTQAEAGDVCKKPPGNWNSVHNRFLLGDGTQDNANFVLSSEQLGIRGDFSQAAGPLGLVSYRSGELYFHGGGSLQECIVPVITARLRAKKEQEVQAKIVLEYKNGATRITTRLPVVDVFLELIVGTLFSQEKDIEILLEAHDKKGQVVGEAKPGGPVNPATGTITLRPRERFQVTMKMQLEYEGKFTIKALNPTTLAIYCKIDLETDYAV